MSEDEDAFKLEIEANPKTKSLAIGIVLVAFISFIIGGAMVESLSENSLEDGLNEVCYRFGADDVREVEFNGTSKDGDLKIRCSIGKIEKAIDEYQISIPISNAETSIYDPTE